MMFRNIAGIILALLLSVFSMGSLASSTVERPDRHRIMMVLWRGCEDACRGFQKYLNARDLPIDLIMRNADRDPLAFPKLVAEARSLDVDLVVTWGTTTTLGMVGRYDNVDPDIHLTDIPVLFMIVTDPVGAGVVPSLEKPGRNVSGTLVVVPEEVQLRAIQSYRPFKKIGIIYNTDEVNAVVSVEKVREAAEVQGITVVARQVPLDVNGRPIADSLPGLIADLADEVELLYIGSSSFILINRDLFTKTAIEHDLPVVAAGEVPVVHSDALMGLVSRYHNIGQLTAAKAEQILAEDADPATLPIEALSRFSLIINMEVAHKLGLYPPIDVLRFAEVIKEQPE